MALIRETTGSQHSKTKLFLYEETGAYDATDNPGGWGSGTADPNPDLADVADVGNTKGIVIMVEHSSGTYTWDNTADIQARGWPNINGQKLVLQASDFGLTEWPDGKITITTRCSGEYTYNDGSGDVTEGFSAEHSFILYLTGKVLCCVEQMAHAIDPSSWKKFCEDPKVKRFAKGELLLSRIEHAAHAGRYTEADEHLALLQELCQTEAGDCGC